MPPIQYHSIGSTTYRYQTVDGDDFVIMRSDDEGKTWYEEFRGEAEMATAKVCESASGGFLTQGDWRCL